MRGPLSCPHALWRGFSALWLWVDGSLLTGPVLHAVGCVPTPTRCQDAFLSRCDNPKASRLCPVAQVTLVENHCPGFFFFLGTLSNKSGSQGSGDQACCWGTRSWVGSRVKAAGRRQPGLRAAAPFCTQLDPSVEGAGSEEGSWPHQPALRKTSTGSEQGPGKGTAPPSSGSLLEPVPALGTERGAHSSFGTRTRDSQLVTGPPLVGHQERG